MCHAEAKPSLRFAHGQRPFYALHYAPGLARHTQALAIMNERICYFCGNEATTREHVPPKGFFPKNQRRNLITVPSCSIHNTQKSGNDEYFRLLIAAQVWPELPKELQDTIVRSFKRRPALARKLVQNSVNENNGFFHYDAEHERLYASLESIGRGIIFREFNVIKRGTPELIMPNFTHLDDTATEEMRKRFVLAQIMSYDMMFEIKCRGENHEIFSYKCTKDFVQFTFFKKLSTTMAFSESG